MTASDNVKIDAIDVVILICAFGAAVLAASLGVSILATLWVGLVAAVWAIRARHAK